MMELLIWRRTVNITLGELISKYVVLTAFAEQ